MRGYRCSKCGETDSSKFSPTSRWCKVCQREAVRDGRYRKLGVSRDEYLAILHGQHGACAICNKHEVPVANGVRGLHLDHDHATGKRRGVLCSRCNQLLGWAKDNVDLLAKCIEYIKAHAG